MADTKETIRLLESRRYRAMCEADADKLAQLLADSLVYAHSKRWQMLAWQSTPLPA